MHIHNWIINLHNYIKNNIYDDVQLDYHKVKMNLEKSDPRDDYQMGYDQAVIDFRKAHRFHNYPGSILKISNSISKNKILEISEFINGYHAGEIHILDKLSR